MNSSSRNGARVRNLAVHTAEGARRVADLRAYFDRIGTASCHAAADDTGALAEAGAGFVPYDRAAWTIRNGNGWTDNLELCAFAAWTRAQWLAAPRLLEACALWIARRSVARGFPIDKLTVAQLRAQQTGTIDHDDYTDATGDGTHWDVGENFPWDVVIPRARALAGNPAPAPTPTRKRRRRMWLTRDSSTGAYYVMNALGELRHCRTLEEVRCLGWLLDDTRAANAPLSQNARFHDVLLQLFAREPVALRVGMQAAGEPLGAPAEVDDEDAIGPPPGFDEFLDTAMPPLGGVEGVER